MPRRAIIIMLVVLIVGILGGTAVLLLARFQDDGELAQGSPSSNPTPGQCDSSDPTLDADADGLPNGDEKLWTSNPCIPDTDGDGFKDGEEIKNGHNPTIAAPNDVVPAGFVPGRGVIEAASGGTTPAPTLAPGEVLPIDKDLNVTAAYQQQATKTSDNQSEHDAMVQFANTQPISTSLPVITDTSITILPDNNPTTLQRYASFINDYSGIVDQSRLSLALDTLGNNHDAQQAQFLASGLHNFSEALRTVPVPPVAVSLNKLLLGYTVQVGATLNEGVTSLDSDFVRTLVAIHQAQALSTQYDSLINQELSRLSDTAAAQQQAPPLITP